MEEKKRSVAVVMFGWLIVIFSTVGLMFSLVPTRYYFAGTGSTIPYKFVILSVLNLIAGISVLLLNEWGRRFLMVLKSVCIVFIIVGFFHMLPALLREQTLETSMERVFQAKRNMVADLVPLELQPKAFEKIDNAEALAEKVFPVFLFVLFLGLFSWNMLVIYFFSLKHVREQFIPHILAPPKEAEDEKEGQGQQ
ncbi:hypothetical protein ACFL1E_03585 [Candidatus Omnitrophota bacterium]